MVSASVAEPPPLLVMRQIRKSFAGVQALLGVDFEVRAGEVHGLVGENGAGKSTLMRILSGAVQADGGETLLDGISVRFPTPQSAQAAGVAMIHQELSLVPSTSVAANVLLGHEPRGRLGLLDLREMNRRAAELMVELDTPVEVTRRVEEFNIATQQMIEVAKVLSQEARLIVMDEPTSALADAEVEKLFGIIRALRDRGVAIVYISHKMEEIYQVCDRVTVLRDGEYIGTADTRELPREQLIQWMVGRKIEQLFPKSQAQRGEEVLRVEGMSLEAGDGTGRKLVDGVSFSLHAGEILGLAGLRGSGASELMGCIFGQYGGRARGKVLVGGEEAGIRNPSEAIRQGVAMLTNDRKVTGLVLPMSVLHNLTLASLPKAAPGGILRRSREMQMAQPLVQNLAIKAASPDIEVNSLSGGNQQKVALAKWLMTEPLALLLDEPTRGVDVGAKAEVYELMNRLVAEGKGILLITSELPELLAMSDRLLVMHRGRVTAELGREEATQERVMAAAMEAGQDA